MPDPDRLIARLRNPALFGARCTAIDLLETHISWVLLTGEFAYKIKKPVDFGFLDFSSLPQRRFFCHEELRLNRRLAPKLYLDVITITGSPDSPRIAGAGPILEYAVKLRQFDENDLGDRLAQDGHLQASHMDELAATLAQFHAHTPRSDANDRYGRPEAIAAVAEENFTHLRNPAIAGDEQRLEAVCTWTRRQFEALRETLLERKAKGYVRECHGDLHLGNIVLFEGKLTPFDCIEFSEDLRWIDVMSELAFIFMDLEVRSQAALASRLLNRYLEITGDYSGLAVLDYYRVYRAIVRAKIAALTRSHCECPDERGVLATRQQAYLNYATGVIQSRSPLLIITHGFSGSGKSHVATLIADKLPAIRVSSDIERKRLAGLSAEARTASTPLHGIYSPEFSRRTYEHLLATAHGILAAGFNVIVDATFLTAAQRQAQRQLAADSGAAFLILDIDAPEAVLRQRVADRLREGVDPSEADEAVLQRQMQYANPLDETERKFAVAVNAAAELDAAGIIAALSARAVANRRPAQ